ncbi:unnamed protein product, partial [Schistosoma mattheei]
HEEFWKEKSDKDITQFKQELNELKDKKEKNLSKLSELSLLYKEYEAVVLSDRIEKEKARQREEQEELELLAACKIQNWWRTVCVQHNLGPYGKKKRKGTKTKKGKGKKKHACNVPSPSVDEKGSCELDSPKPSYRGCSRPPDLDISYLVLALKSETADDVFCSTSHGVPNLEHLTQSDT